MTQLRHGFLLIILFGALSVHAQTTNETILTATAAMQAAVPRAQADPWHPVFHVTSPAQWMNDPNGPIYYHGYYHLFYQLTPFSDQSGIKYWGHVRSRDLVKWEPLPIALWPSAELGEDSIWSGCCTINGDGQPMAFYTSIGKGKSAFDQAVQWAAIGDKDLITWQKSPANPVLSDEVNDGTKIYDWRDPFVFHDGKKTFLVLGGHLEKDGGAAVNIYEAQNAALTKWKYRGVLFHIPAAPTAECPNFFKLGHQWVLIVSPYGSVRYYVGDFDATTCRFTPHANGLLDSGPGFYAPNTMQLPNGRRLTWGWVNGFPGGHGWNGCLSLPRQLSLSPEGQLLQSPAPQLAKLRGPGIETQNIHLDKTTQALALPQTNTLEINADIDLKTATDCELMISDGTTSPITISFTKTAFNVTFSVTGQLQTTINGSGIPLHLAPGQTSRNLRVYIDRSVLEIFVNDSICYTRIIQPLGSNAHLLVSSFGGSADIKCLQAWPMQSIW